MNEDEYQRMKKNYCHFRKDFRYYRETAHIAKELYEKPSGRVIDIGTKDIMITLQMFRGFEKTALDNDFPTNMKRKSDIIYISQDLFEFNPSKLYDIVLCQQMLEHMNSPKSAFMKVKSLCLDTLVISVPYGSWHKSVHDPIDEEKVFTWTNMIPQKESIVEDFGVKRYIAGYKI